ncbi:hypothetical protein SCLCIDRAFT_1113143 [Scleroderma citrinum Foug A]|uniref:Uncharacterized protein n=1 Tax=Scleroderma citrinum Foug A TaxID=1036808 RepID=A0A0C3E4D1_9AGAM|nr:hypothetical protein SCLCIDRAFT_1113143 [Scleroderma citrinum Foug A]
MHAVGDFPNHRHQFIHLTYDSSSHRTTITFFTRAFVSKIVLVLRLVHPPRLCSVLPNTKPGPNSPTVLTTLNDSAMLLSVSNHMGPTFIIETQNWASEPMRRMRHAASSGDGKVWIIGGEKPDGSGNAFSERFIFNPSGMGFTPISSGPYSPPDILAMLRSFYPMRC